MMTTTQIPEGYRMNAQGHLVPETTIKPIDLERDKLVLEVAHRARTLSARLSSFKAQTMSDIASFVQVSAEQYDARIGGEKGNVTLFSFDGRYKLVRQISDHMTFDERLQVAKSLIDECLKSWAENSQDEIKVIVNDAFQVDKEGRISTGRILGLRRLNINDPQWKKAMDAISESIQVTGSKAYVRIYERVGDADAWRAISLDVAAV